MIHPITLYGDPVLKKRAEDIKPGTDLGEIIEDMFETMHAASGIGLAAPQIGKSIRLFVVDGSPLEEKDMVDFKKVFVNPEIMELDGDEWVLEEGCLSIPTIRENISRQDMVLIKYFDENWVEQEEEFSGMKARIIQHEYDHIEGVLFTDHLQPLIKRMLKTKLTNISKGKVKADYRVKIPKK